MKLLNERLARRLGLPLLLAGALTVAGCTGETATFEPQPTEPAAATQPVEALPTEAATAMPTEADVAAPTEAATQQPAATAAGTDPAAVNTPGAGETAMPGVNEVEEILVQSSNLIGMNIQALEGVTVGTIRDVLVNETGEIQYIVVDLPAIGGAEAQSVVVDWSALQAVVEDSNLTDADLEDVTLNFNGSATDLAGALPLLADQDWGAIITNTGTELPAELNNLVSLAQVNSLALEGAANEELGQLQDTLVDLRAGTVDYVVLDMTAVGGQPNTAVMVPWEQLTVDPVQAAAAQALLLDVTAETLQNVPPVDLSELPTFIDPRQVNWETLQDFWDSLS